MPLQGVSGVLQVRVLVIEPYYGGSHRAWADGYAATSRHDVSILSHEARFWKWRMKGAHLTLAELLAADVERHGPPDVVLASSMMDVAGLLGAARRHLEAVPVAVYFHENQFTYPRSPLDRLDLSYPMTNWTSAAVADLVVFNSLFHEAQFLEAARRFLRQFPDHRHGGLVDGVADRSIVLPVGVDLARIDRRRPGVRRRPPLLLWNQRWEHDKGPDRLVGVIERLVELEVPFRAAVTGERFVSSPDSFDRLPELLGNRLVQLGFAPDDRYVDLLLSADVVLSTAEQEFFGVAVVEAMYAGAFPVLPNHVVYPERIPESLHHRCLYSDDADLVSKLSAALDGSGGGESAGRVLNDAVAEFDWRTVAPRYDAVLEGLRDRSTR